MGVAIELLANDLEPIGEALKKLLSSSKEAFFAVAYGTHSAFKHLDESGAVTNFLKRGGRLRAIFDVEKYLTDPDLIEELCTIPGGVECRLYGPAIREGAPVSEIGSFHPKVYYFVDQTEGGRLLAQAT